MLDADQRFSTTLTHCGTYDYFLFTAPQDGKIIVRR